MFELILYIICILLCYSSRIVFQYKIEYDKIYTDENLDVNNYLRQDEEEVSLSFKIVVPKNNSLIYTQEYQSREYGNSVNHYNYIFQDI
jgi:hypothetical protein